MIFDQSAKMHRKLVKINFCEKRISKLSKLSKRTFSYCSCKWNPLTMRICPIQNPYPQENVRFRILVRKKISDSDSSSRRIFTIVLFTTEFCHHQMFFHHRIFLTPNLLYFVFLKYNINEYRTMNELHVTLYATYLWYW